MPNNQAPPYNTPFDQGAQAPNDDWTRFINWLYGIVLGVQNVAAYGYSQPTTGFSYSVPANVEIVTFDPAGILATGAVILPSQVFDGQRVYLNSTQQITSFTAAPYTGFGIKNAFSGTLSPGQGLAYYYSKGTNTWYRFI